MEIAHKTHTHRFTHEIRLVVYTFSSRQNLDRNNAIVKCLFFYSSIEAQPIYALNFGHNVRGCNHVYLNYCVLLGYGIEERAKSCEDCRHLHRPQGDSRIDAH